MNFRDSHSLICRSHQRLIQPIDNFCVKFAFPFPPLKEFPGVCPVWLGGVYEIFMEISLSESVKYLLLLGMLESEKYLPLTLCVNSIRAYN